MALKVRPSLNTIIRLNPDISHITCSLLSNSKHVLLSLAIGVSLCDDTIQNSSSISTNGVKIKRSLIIVAVVPKFIMDLNKSLQSLLVLS